MSMTTITSSMKPNYQTNYQNEIQDITTYLTAAKVLGTSVMDVYDQISAEIKRIPNSVEKAEKAKLLVKEVNDFLQVLFQDSNTLLTKLNHLQEEQKHGRTS